MTFSRPVKARARQITPMHASVPELTKRTISILGTAEMTISARTFSRRHGAPKLVPFFIVSPKAASTCKIKVSPRLFARTLKAFSKLAKAESSVVSRDGSC